MSNPSKRKGTQFEVDLVKYLRGRGHDTERLRQAGTKDEGDVVTKIGGLPFVIEAKNVARLNLAGWLKEAEVERQNYIEARGIPDANYVVIHKAKGKGVDQAYVTMPLWQWLDQVEAPF